MKTLPYIEIDHFASFKKGQMVCGDTFMSRRIKDKQRIISVLSDGLGSGVKANVLSTLTSTMALNYISNNFDLPKAAQMMMKTLPVCKTRKISYSTFSIVDINEHGWTKIIEYDNPSFLLFKGNKPAPVQKKQIDFVNHRGEKTTLYYSNFYAGMGDRIVLFSDGIPHSGIGQKEYPFGWGQNLTSQYITDQVALRSDLSARQLAQAIVQEALVKDKHKAQDDMTCGVIYFREPRKTLVMSGPPIAKERDKELARIVKNYPGRKVICGGTTANIVSRELGRALEVDMRSINPTIPPTSIMEGTDLVTEGMITLGNVLELLESNTKLDTLPSNGATRLVNMLINSDIIDFVVGTKINDAHQDPSLPVELEIRRNIFKRISQLLEEKYLKKTTMRFI